MRIMPLLKAACLSLMLSACVAPLLMMSPTSQLMWALLKPLVGFDPNEANLFEQPLIKDRMSAILGPHYDSTMQLLKTANELQQEGPLFYVVSRYAPMPDIAKQAGMVWNSQTNQMSVLLQQGDGTTQTFGENLASSAPIWPTAMQGWQTQINTAPPTLTTLTDMAVSSAAATVTQGATNAVTTPAKQAVSAAAATVTQEATNAVTAPAKQAVSAASHTAGESVADAARAAEAAEAATRAKAEAEMEALLE